MDDRRPAAPGCRQRVLFCEAVPEPFVCPIGGGVLADPVDCPACQNSFCKPCVTAWIERSGASSGASSCPLCRAALSKGDLRPSSRPLKDFIASLEVFCDHKNVDGCTWRGKLSALPMHVVMQCSAAAATSAPPCAAPIAAPASPERAASGDREHERDATASTPAPAAHAASTCPAPAPANPVDFPVSNSPSFGSAAAVQAAALALAPAPIESSCDRERDEVDREREALAPSSQSSIAEEIGRVLREMSAAASEGPSASSSAAAVAAVEDSPAGHDHDQRTFSQADPNVRIVSQDNDRVVHLSQRRERFNVVRAPPALQLAEGLSFYFEARVESMGSSLVIGFHSDLLDQETGGIGVQFGSVGYNTNQLAGSRKGLLFCSSAPGLKCKPVSSCPPFGTGDVIGAGIVSRPGPSGRSANAFFTRNGSIVARILCVPVPIGRLFPACSFKGRASLRPNFGSAPFAFDPSSLFATREQDPLAPKKGEPALVVIGGVAGLQQEPRRVVQRFDASLGDWTATAANAPPTVASAGAPAVAVRAGVVIAGGGRSKRPTTECWLLEAGRSEPRRIAPLAEARARCALVVLGQEIFAVGGWGEGGRVLSSVERLRDVGGRWAAAPPMKAARAATAAAALGGKIYVVGGITSGSRMLSTAERFDPAAASSSAAWTDLPSLPSGRVRSAMAAVADNRLLVLGGTSEPKSARSAPSASSGVYAFSPSNGSWSKLADTPTPRRAAACVSPSETSRFVFVLGGHTDEMYCTDRCDVLDVAANAWYIMPPLLSSTFRKLSALFLPADFLPSVDAATLSGAALRGTRVRRGADWQWGLWGDQDGGNGQEGSIVGGDQTSVKVCWGRDLGNSTGAIYPWGRRPNRRCLEVVRACRAEEGGGSGSDDEEDVGVELRRRMMMMALLQSMHA